MGVQDKNKRLHDSISADEYLTQWETFIDGSSKQRNTKQGQEGTVEAQINADGLYSAEQFNEDGSRTFVVQGDDKHYAESSTKTIGNSIDTMAFGGEWKKIADGVLKETGGNFEAHNGPSVLSAAEGHKTFAVGGDGMHVMHGDQTFVAESGRIDTYSAGYTITSGKTVEVKSTEDVSIETAENTAIKADNNVSVDGIKVVRITAGTSANVICGICELGMTKTQAKLTVGPMASITMDPSSIRITCGASIIIMSVAGIEIATPALNITTAATNMDTGSATINSGGIISMAAGAEAVLTGGGGALVGSGAELALVAPLVFIG